MLCSVLACRSFASITLNYIASDTPPPPLWLFPSITAAADVYWSACPRRMPITGVMASTTALKSVKERGRTRLDRPSDRRVLLGLVDAERLQGQLQVGRCDGLPH